MGPAGQKDSSKSLVQKLKGRIQAENLKIVSSEENKIQEVQYPPLCHLDRQMDRGTPDTTSSHSRMPVSFQSCLLVLEASSPPTTRTDGETPNSSYQHRTGWTSGHHPTSRAHASGVRTPGRR